jgi:hypothetical protein
VVRPIASPSPIALPLSVLVGRSGSDVRVGLDLVLEEGLYLTAAALDAAVGGRADELVAITRALDQNSSTLAAIVGAVGGRQAQQALLDVQRGQTVALLAYVRGDAARASLAAVTLGSALVDPLLAQRTQAQLDIADAALARDVSRETAALRSAAQQADVLGRLLAAALAAEVPADAPGPTDNAEVQLRLALDRRLQERVYLLGRAISASAGGRAAEQTAAIQAADSVCLELGQQLAVVYGDATARDLSSALRERNAAVISLASGGDREPATGSLDRARTALDGLLAAANPLLPRGMLLAVLRTEDQELVGAVDAAAAHDWTAAYGQLHQAARVSQRFGDALAQATVDRYPARYLAPATPSVP